MRFAGIAAAPLDADAAALRALATLLAAAEALGVAERTLEDSVEYAKVLATDAALANAADNVQNHGGMGFTLEADAHLDLKRAWLLEHALGTRVAHLDALAAPWRAE